MSYLESSLSVMALPDLLQWVEMAKKTGLCRFTRGAIFRQVFFRNGQIVACSSNEPHLLLGQFLIAHGRIDELTLQTYMDLQQRTRRSLGELLIRAGKITDHVLQRLIVAKAEETIFGLFDWPDGTFRFDPDCPPQKDSMKIELDVHSVLMEGARRFDELNMIREAFPSPNAVLHKTDRDPDAPTVASFMGQKLYEAVNGERTLAEIVLLCRTSEFLACSFLLTLVQRGLVRVGETRQEARPSSPEIDVADALAELVEQSEFEKAVDLIEDLGIKPEQDEALAKLIAEAESGFLAHAYDTTTAPDAVPHRSTEKSASQDDGLSPEALLLLEMINGTWDVRSLVWIVPMRTIDVIRGLIQLVRAGFVELQPAAQSAGSNDVTLDTASAPVT